MSFPTPEIIVTLPGRSMAELKEQARAAAAAGADAVEVRVDRLDPAEREALRGSLPLAVPALLTLRSSAEGGRGPDTAAERESLLQELRALGSRWVDEEILRDLTDRPRTAAGPGAPSPGAVHSVHLSGEPEARRLSELLHRPVPSGGFLKVVQAASVSALFATVIPAFSGLSGTGVVVHSIGPSGPLLRAWSRRFGMPAVFAAPPAAVSAPVEPSQIPVDRLGPFLRAGASGRAFAVLGHPVGDSLSPALHSRWVSKAGLPGLYIALDITSEAELLSALPELGAGGFCGFNVTRPWKHAALAGADRASRAAEQARAANLLTVDPDGSISADNTDIAALIRRLGELREAGRWDGERLIVLGTGATTRSTLVAAGDLARDRRVWGRNREAADAVAAEQGAASVRESPSEAPGLVVNTIPWPTGGGAPGGIPDLVSRASYVVDWTYGPGRPPLGEYCARHDIDYEDGRRLLVYQAAESFTQWWEAEPDIGEGLAEVGLA